jgi:hypothetical protein
MLHHAVMDDGDDGELALLESWLAVLARHTRVRWRSMRSLQQQPARARRPGSATLQTAT